MRKKIAVFAGGWGGEYLQEVLAGIIESAHDKNIDIFAFVNFSVHTDVVEANIAEINFFKLPDLSDFDGVILLANSFNTTEELEYLSSKIKELNFPAISIEYEVDGIPCIATDNYSGMADLVAHLIRSHQVKEMVFIGGPATHPECQERLRAIRDTASANGITIPADNILFADWSKMLIPGLIEDWIKAHGHCPDAFLCANDIMAMAACEALSNLGYHLPEDVIVTGYDCITPAQHFTPSITSVNHEWYPMGMLAFDCMYQLLIGEEVAPKTMLKTRFVPAASCGCPHHSVSGKESLGRALCEHQMDAILVDSHFRHFYNAVKKVDNAIALHDSFTYLMERSHGIEGEKFGMFLDPEFFNVVDDNSNLTSEGYPDRMFCVVGLRSGLDSIPPRDVTIKEAIFSASKHSPEAGYYLFLPLYTEIYSLGFAMLNGALNVANENQYYIWTRHIAQSLEQVRSNITISNLYQKMKLLSITDPLTGAYNRAGCETISYPKLIGCKEQGLEGVIMLIDVDHMKVINDKYGHSCGDQALRTVVSTLRASLPEGFDVARFGGDEFFIAGTMEKASEVEINALTEKMELNLKEAVEAAQITFPLTISIGYAIITPSDVTDIEKGIVVADEKMYTTKEEHHQKGKLD